MPRRRQSITRKSDRLIEVVIHAVEVIGVSIDDRAEPVEIEVRVARHHRIPRPLNQFSSFTKRTLALRPFQTRADALVLIILRHRHHVGITEDLVVCAHSGKMMNKPHHAFGDKRAQRPAASLARNDQMSPWGKFQIRKAECFALQVNTSIKLFNRRALTNCDFIHPQPSSLQWTCWYLNRCCEPTRNTVLQGHSAAKSSSSLRPMMMPSSLMVGSCPVS